MGTGPFYILAILCVQFLYWFGQVLLLREAGKGLFSSKYQIFFSKAGPLLTQTH